MTNSDYKATGSQGKEIIKKNDRIQRQGKIEITHKKNDKKEGYKTKQSTEGKQIHINETTYDR
jgi:hypothetical protein